MVTAIYCFLVVTDSEMAIVDETPIVWYGMHKANTDPCQPEPSEKTPIEIESFVCFELVPLSWRELLVWGLGW